MSISLTKVTIGPVIPLPHSLNSPITVLLYGGGVFRVTSPGVWVSPVLCVTPCMGFRCCAWGVCRVPSVGVCVSPVLRVLPLVWVSVLYVGCVSRPICGCVGVPRPLCEPVYGSGCTRGVFHVTIVGVWVSPVYCSLITWSLSPPGVDTYFLISLRSICYHRNTVSPQLQHSNILFLKLPWWS